MQGAALDKRGGLKVGWRAPTPTHWPGFVSLVGSKCSLAYLCAYAVPWLYIPGEGLREKGQGIGVGRGALVPVGDVHARRHESLQTVTETVL